MQSNRILALTLAFATMAAPALAQDPAPAPTPAPTAAPAPAPAPVATPQPDGSREMTPLGAAWRSTLVPGWGQRYKGETKKGWIYTGVAGALVLGSLATYGQMQSATSAYYDAPAGTPEATLNAKHARASNATVVFDVTAGLTAAFWAYNVADSGFTPLEHLRFKEARVRDVFPAVHKYYESNPIAVVGVENRSGEAVSKVRVKFEAPEIMDLPAESEPVDLIPAGLGKSIEVTAAFNKQIFEVGRSEPKAVQAKITVEYEVGRKKREIVRTTTFTVHNRNAIVWDDMRKMAAFVTPRDEGVKAFASATAQAAAKDPISSVKTIADAAAYFDALGAHGIVYVTDPRAPFTYFDGNAEAVDYLSYPRETLARKTGDCDDLTALYASLLESSGIPAALVDVPGHVYLMFDSGLTPEEMKGYVGSEDAYYVRNGTAWVPMEVTAVGKPFHQAWALAAAETKKWVKAGKLELVDVISAQAQFPSSAPDLGEVPADVKTLVAAKFAPIADADRKRLQSTEQAARNRAVAEIKNRKLAPAIEANEIGIVFARDGNFGEAERWFNQAIATDATLARAYNNLANLAFLRGQPEQARKLYEDALAKGENALVLVNYAQLELDSGHAARAKDLFLRATRIEPVYKREFPELASLIGPAGTAVAASGRGTGGKAAAVGKKDPRSARWIP